MAISVTRPHPFDHATARRRVDVLAQTLSRKLSLRTSWDGDRLSFKRTGARGHIDVTPDHIHVEISTSPLLPISDARLRQQVNAVLDEHIPPMPTMPSGDHDGEVAKADDADDADEAETAGDAPESHEDEVPPATETAAASAQRSDEAQRADAGPLGSLTSGLLGAAVQTGTASLKAARSLLFPPDQLSDLPEAQRARLERIGQQLQQFREEAGLSLDDVSERLGIDAALLEAMERGTARLSLPLLRRLYEILPTIPSGWIDRFIPPHPPDANSPDD